MSFKKISLAAVAALCLPAAQAFAVPSLSLIDNGGGSATLQVTLDAAGAIGAEISLEATGGLTLTAASIADAVAFDEANPGDNPFIAGSPVGGDAVGLDLTDIASGMVFASFGGPGTAAGTYNFLDLTYTGTGALDAEGYVAQLGVLGDLLTAPTLNIGGGLVGDTNDDGVVNTLDIDPFVQALTDPAGYDAIYPGIRVDRADTNFDLAVNTLDIDPFVALITGGAATAAPEPAATMLLLTGLVGLARGRRRC
ncbi:hypothetical protein Pla123a_06630 [Posidoniimonas polymericola]|uniref:PEP-CTERM protein-sorting domain-containing protein n=1 Tax=Posidoniimonas polymericola TaxID=2528002 RepID=A0A5C5ZF90_9BACT|nr:PEP-CTERM sorting domain-containing protein [Posidoniimonas polymericola]TWT85856.1 hypothetical protein Pla123a_06630 [Posidoniimonas polymericola]